MFQERKRESGKNGDNATDNITAVGYAGRKTPPDGFGWSLRDPDPPFFRGRKLHIR